MVKFIFTELIPNSVNTLIIDITSKLHVSRVVNAKLLLEWRTFKFFTRLEERVLQTQFITISRAEIRIISEFFAPKDLT
jgi:hypothetical protein